MRVERIRPGVFQITLHAFEMSALVAAARIASQDSKSEMPSDAVDQLKAVLASYDEEIRRINA